MSRSPISTRKRTGDAGDLVEQLTVAADDLGVTVRIVPAEEWTHGEAKGICEQLSLVDVQPLVEVRDRENETDLARTLIHEYAHALLHFDVDDDTERAKREVEAEAVAYVGVGAAFHLLGPEFDFWMLSPIGYSALGFVGFLVIGGWSTRDAL